MAELTANNLQAFNEDGEKRFLEKAKERVKRHMGNEYYACFTDEKIHNFTILGIKRARAHNLISEGEIFDYLWLMVKFGAYFDLDVHYHWLYGYIDGDPDNLMQGETIHGVDAGKEYLQLLYFPDDVWLERFTRLKEEYANGDLTSTAVLERGQLLQAIKGYNPDNKVIIQDDLLEKIYAQVQPKDLQIDSSFSHLIWFILNVDLGFRFYDNPLYPEIRDILKSKIVEKEKIIKILELKIECISTQSREQA